MGGPPKNNSLVGFLPQQRPAPGKRAPQKEKIQAENALYGGSDGKTLKLADFGLAVYITPAEGPLTRARGSRRGLTGGPEGGSGVGRMSGPLPRCSFGETCGGRVPLFFLLSCWVKGDGRGEAV